MKTIVSVIRSGVLAVILASPMMTFAESTTTGGAGIERMVGKVVYIVGQAELETKDGNRKPIVKNMSIPEGSHLFVKERSKVNLQMQDGETRQLEANTSWDINVFQYDPAHPEDSLVRTTLKEGEVTTKTGQAGHDARDQYRLNTPIAAIGVLGTEYTVRVKNGETIVILRQGIVSVGRFSADCTRDSYGPCSGDSSVRLTEQQRGLAAVVREDQPKPIIMPAPQALRGTTTATPVATVKSEPKKEETASNSNTSKTETKKSEEEGKSTTTASSSNSKSNSQASNSADTTTAKTTTSDEGKKTSSSTATTAEETTTATADTSNSKTTTSASSSTSKSSASSATDGTTTANSTTVASSSTDTTKAASESAQPLSSASTNTASGSKSAATETATTVASSGTDNASKTSSTDLVDALTSVATGDTSAKSSTSSVTSSTSLSSSTLATTSAAKASTQTTDLVDALTTVAVVDKSSVSNATSSSTASSSTLVSASTTPAVVATVTPVTTSLSASTTAALAASESASNSLTSTNVAKPLATTTATDLVESVKTDAITTLAANTTLPTTPVLESNTDLTNNTKDTTDTPTTPTTNPVVKWSKYDPSALVVSSGTMTDQVNSLYEKLTMANASNYEIQRLKDAATEISQPQDVKLKMGSYDANVTNAKTGLTANATIKDDASLTLSSVKKTYNAQFTVESGLLAAPAAITSKGSYDKGILQDDGTNAGTTFQGAFGVKGTAVDAATNFERQIDPDLKAAGAMNWSGTLDTSTSTPVTGLVTP